MRVLSRFRQSRLFSGRAVGVFWSTIWLVYLAIPLLEILGSDIPLSTRLAMIGLTVAFVAAYVAYWVTMVMGPWRRWRLYGAALVLGVGVVAAVLGAEYGLGYVLCYAAAAVATALVPRFRLAIVAVIGVALLAVVIGLLAGVYPWSVVLQAMIVLSGGGGVLGYVVLDMQNDRLRAAHEEIARLAVAEERLRFSRDLHDLLGHSLSVIVLKAELARRVAERSPARTARELGDIEDVAREALREVREAVAGYRQPSLSGEIDRAATTLREAGLQVQVAGAGGTLPGPVDGALAWTVREATTNVIRHASARRVRFEIFRAPAAVALSVTNDGRPGATASGEVEGNGLRGLRERLEALGGELTVGPGQVDGFSLRASLPLRPAPDPAAPAPALP